jgi:hypothetical protein
LEQVAHSARGRPPHAFSLRSGFGARQQSQVFLAMVVLVVGVRLNVNEHAVNR